jgi:heme exporter protein C
VTAVTSTASRGTRVLGALALAGSALLLWLALVATPADAVQGDGVRLLYLHVPTVSAAYLAFAVTAAGSALYLWRRSPFWDLVAGASAEVGVVMTALTLVVGMLWGRISWGVYWVWDARLTTTALLEVLFLGYLAVRRVGGEPGVRSRRAAVAGLVAAADLPIVHFSVEWWRTLHQGPTLARLDPQIDGLMLFTLMLGLAVFAVIYAWLVVHRFRSLLCEDRLADRGLEFAIRERWGEGGAAVPVEAATGG